MSALCVLVAGTVRAVLPALAFTLAWTHSVEKVRWEEDWELRDGGLLLTAARVQGSGAGMEVPESAVRIADGWEYHPGLSVPLLTLAHSGYTAPYLLCMERACRPLSAFAGPPAPGVVVDIAPCPPQAASPPR